LLRPGFIKIKDGLFGLCFLFSIFRATTLFSGFGSAARGFVYLFPFAAQSGAIDPSAGPLEKLVQKRRDDALKVTGRHSQAARDPCRIVGKAAPWRHPHQPQEAVISAIFR
jgi:hypothetical protein